MRSLGTAYMPGSSMEVLRITADLDQDQIQARWRIKGIPLHSYIIRPWRRNHPHRWVAWNSFVGCPRWEKPADTKERILYFPLINWETFDSKSPTYQSFSFVISDENNRKVPVSGTPTIVVPHCTRVLKNISHHFLLCLSFFVRYFDAFSTFDVGTDGLIHRHKLDKVHAPTVSSCTFI